MRHEKKLTFNLIAVKEKWLRSHLWGFIKCIRENAVHELHPPVCGTCSGAQTIKGLFTLIKRHFLQSPEH